TVLRTRQGAGLDDGDDRLRPRRDAGSARRAGEDSRRDGLTALVEIRIVKGLAGAREADGVVVVIDVMRAFTTAAYAFDAGLTEIELVSTAEQAFAVEGFRMGEIGGRLIPGFDHNNSPSRLRGRR